MSPFQSARDSHIPACFEWRSNGCSNSPDHPMGFNFLPSCQRHDFGYHNARQLGIFDKAEKARIDQNFRRDMKDVCAKYKGFWSKPANWECRGLAKTYYEAVKYFGGGDAQ